MNERRDPHKAVILSPCYFLGSCKGLDLNRESLLQKDRQTDTVQGASALNPSLWPPGEIINMPVTTATSQKLKATTKMVPKKIA